MSENISLLSPQVTELVAIGASIGGNCVLNLVPDKAKAFSEIYRILKPDAHFCISDV